MQPNSSVFIGKIINKLATPNTQSWYPSRAHLLLGFNNQCGYLCCLNKLGTALAYCWWPLLLISVPPVPILASSILTHLPMCQQAEVSSGACGQVEPIGSLLDTRGACMPLHLGYTLCLKVGVDHSLNDMWQYHRSVQFMTCTWPMVTDHASYLIFF